MGQRTGTDNLGRKLAIDEAGGGMQWKRSNDERDLE